jgi:hypothetical protein
MIRVVAGLRFVSQLPSHRANLEVLGWRPIYVKEIKGLKELKMQLDWTVRTFYDPNSVSDPGFAITTPKVDILYISSIFSYRISVFLSSGYPDRYKSLYGMLQLVKNAKQLYVFVYFIATGSSSQDSQIKADLCKSETLEKTLGSKLPSYKVQGFSFRPLGTALKHNAPHCHYKSWQNLL